MLGAPLAPMTFPATDRPSAGFLARYERSLRDIPDDALGAPLSLALNGVVEAPFADCLASMGPVSRYLVAGFGGAHALLAVPDVVLHALIEHAYGGDGSEDAPLPVAPTRLASRFGYRVASTLASALPGEPVNILGATDAPAEAVSLKASALACGFELTAGTQSLGAIGLCLPLAALAAVETSSGLVAADEDWTDRLQHAVAGARLNVRCVLARPTLPAGQVAQLVPGSVIPIPSLSEVALIAGGYRIATGVAEACEGRAAITINRTEFLS